MENQLVLNCRDPLGKLPRRVNPVSLVSSRLFDERTATVSIVKGEAIGVEAEVQKGLVRDKSVGDGSGCAAHAHRRRLLQPGMRRARLASSIEGEPLICER
ncbi:MAG TPA: hypothetical protein PLO50_07710 [Nitrospira sp.]|nr:hypothetical protein [Nitrospira sp.]